MDHFFEYDPEEAMLWLAEALSEVNQSAFVGYKQQPINLVAENIGNVTRNLNINKRMIEFLKRSWTPPVNNENERVFKHMINERMRRDKQKQNYQALHKLLPLGTKSDKNSIIQMAIRRIEELQKYKNEFRKQNNGLEMKLLQIKKTNNNVPIFTTKGSSRELERAHITVNVVSPSSGIDSMLESLKCLKNTNDTKAIAIQSSFSPHKFSARLEIETKVGAAEVEREVNTTLWEVEKKFRINS
ncbi:basic helix-loop-helix transcription factor [Lithospermum erythrorhizon]|uniref:Basic helix-loop-helix transcription factor n=1 Tax=Lithospermum erythrorhizon TaxID=34254 RepID=A0AAV3P200_LITER